MAVLRRVQLGRPAPVMSRDMEHHGKTGCGKAGQKPGIKQGAGAITYPPTVRARALRHDLGLARLH